MKTFKKWWYLVNFIYLLLIPIQLKVKNNSFFVMKKINNNELVFQTIKEYLKSNPDEVSEFRLALGDLNVTTKNIDKFLSSFDNSLYELKKMEIKVPEEVINFSVKSYPIDYYFNNNSNYLSQIKNFEKIYLDLFNSYKLLKNFVKIYEEKGIQISYLIVKTKNIVIYNLLLKYEKLKFNYANEKDYPKRFYKLK